jgi:TPR repeat protein
MFLGLILGLGPLMAVAQQSDDLRAVDLVTLQQQATAGDVGAQMELSDRYYKGRGVPIDGMQALTWMRKAAAKGDVKAEQKLGQMMLGGGLVLVNYKEAAVWFRKAAEQGDTRVQVYLARMLANGDWVCMDFTEAASWLRKAADQGDREAISHLADAYEFGKGVSRDLAEARKWYQKAADLGDKLARQSVALLDEKASTPSGFQSAPIPPTPEAGSTCIFSDRSLFQLALRGDPAAKEQLARYPNHIDVPTRKRAELGDPFAEYDMGAYYEALKDYDQAIFWYTQASRYRSRESGAGPADIALVGIAVLRYKPNDPDDSTEASFDSAASVTAMNSTSQYDFRTLSAARILDLLENAASLKVNPAGTRFPSKDRRAGEWFKGCNGVRSNDDYVQDKQGENACFQVFTNFGSAALGDPSNPADMQYIMTALVRGCGLYAPSTDKAFEGRTCGLLGAVLYGIGNAAAAKAVWELAPGCYSQDERAGTPMNGCVRAMTGRDANLLSDLNLKPYQNLIGVFKFQPRRLARLMWRSCSTIHDRESCEFLSSYGATVDMAAVTAVENERHEGIQEFRARNAAELDRARAASEDRRNAVLGALQTMGGADPNAILNAGNQQAAAIRAIGDASAARQWQDAQMRLGSQRATVPPTSQGSNVVAGPATASQGSVQVVTSSTGAKSNVSNSNSSVASGAIQYSTPLATSCVRQFFDPNTYNWLSFENNCGQAIYINYIPHRPGGWAMGGGMHLAPGNHNNTGLSSDEINQTGGFDLYVCPTDSVPVDLNGNVLNANVSEYRCKPQA